MTNPTAEFPLLFGSKWPARGLDTAISSLNIAALAAEYREFVTCAPRRGDRDKAYFVGHTGTTPSGDTSDRREEHLARHLGKHDSRWPWLDGGWVRPLDYQFPLKAWQNDAGIGKIDLLGVTEAGRFVVVELKVHHADGNRGDSPLAALMEALRYAAIVEANHSVIASEARVKFNALVSDEATPAIMLLGTREWWHSWLEVKAAGSWPAPFAGLLDQIKIHIGIPEICMAITKGTSEQPTVGCLAPADLVGSISRLSKE